MGKRGVLPLMGDALEAFSSPFRPVNKQLRKPEGVIRLYRLLGPLPGRGMQGFAVMRFAEIVIFKLRYCGFTKPSGLRYLGIWG